MALTPECRVVVEQSVPKLPECVVDETPHFNFPTLGWEDNATDQ